MPCPKLSMLRYPDCLPHEKQKRFENAESKATEERTGSVYPSRWCFEYPTSRFHCINKEQIVYSWNHKSCQGKSRRANVFRMTVTSWESCKERTCRNLHCVSDLSIPRIRISPYMEMGEQPKVSSEIYPRYHFHHCHNHSMLYHLRNMHRSHNMHLYHRRSALVRNDSCPRGFLNLFWTLPLLPCL